MNELTQIDYHHMLELKTILQNKFDGLIDRIYCYGSRVSKKQQNSDFDLLIVTSKKIDWIMKDKISATIFDYGIDHDIVFDNKYYSKTEFDNTLKYLPFIEEVKSYGVAI